MANPGACSTTDLLRAPLRTREASPNYRYRWQNLLKLSLVTARPLVIKSRLEMTERQDSGLT